LALYGHGCAIIGGHSTTGNGNCAMTSRALCLRIAMAAVALRFDAAGGRKVGSPGPGAVPAVRLRVVVAVLELLLELGALGDE